MPSNKLKSLLQSTAISLVPTVYYYKPVFNIDVLLYQPMTIAHFSGHRIRPRDLWRSNL